MDEIFGVFCWLIAIVLFLETLVCAFMSVNSNLDPVQFALMWDRILQITVAAIAAAALATWALGGFAGN